MTKDSSIKNFIIFGLIFKFLILLELFTMIQVLPSKSKQEEILTNINTMVETKMDDRFRGSDAKAEFAKIKVQTDALNDKLNFIQKEIELNDAKK